MSPEDAEADIDALQIPLDMLAGRVEPLVVGAHAQRAVLAQVPRLALD